MWDFHDFPKEEYDFRYKRARELMDKKGIDGLMATGDFSASSNYRYLSGGHVPRDYQSNFSRPHIVVLPKEGKPTIIVYILCQHEAKSSSWVKDIRKYTQPFSYKIIKEVVEDKGLSDAKIGAELGIDQRIMMPMEEFQKLQKDLPKVQFVDASEIFWELRMTKSDTESERFVKACEIMSKAYEKLFESLEPGMTEIDVQKKLATYIIEEGAYRPPHDQIIINSDTPRRIYRYLGPTDKVLRKGDILFIDAGCIYKGYWGEFSRMGVVGKPTDRQKKNHRIVREVINESLEVMKEGVTPANVVRAAIKAYKSMGVDYSKFKNYLEYPFSHIGHGVGLNSSEPPFMTILDEQPLKAGMCISIEAYLRDIELYGHEECVAITKDGYDVFSTVSRELNVI